MYGQASCRDLEPHSYLPLQKKWCKGDRLAWSDSAGVPLSVLFKTECAQLWQGRKSWTVFFVSVLLEPEGQIASRDRKGGGGQAVPEWGGSVSSQPFWEETDSG